jgi:hypothetical protein
MQMDNTDTSSAVESLYAFLICSHSCYMHISSDPLDLVTTVKTDEEQKLCRCSLRYYFLSLTSKRIARQLFLRNFISGFLRAIDEIRVLLGYDAVHTGISLPKFRYNQSIPSSRVKIGFLDTRRLHQ